nr:hypothetical protein B0A51_00059 [Rachicladosporium sp. CCFEE 5018]
MYVYITNLIALYSTLGVAQTLKPPFSTLWTTTEYLTNGAFTSVPIALSTVAACDPPVQSAINSYCAPYLDPKYDTLIVPSREAETGVSSENGYTVAIWADCDPPQWVPHDWCYRQFEAVCQNKSDNGGYPNMTFGYPPQDSCQNFTILSSPGSKYV